MNDSNQRLDEILKQREPQIDEHFKRLQIWKYGFHTVYLALLYSAEELDYTGGADSAIDYFGRIAELYPKIAELTSYSDISGTWPALSLSQGDDQFPKDINTLYTYAHFSMIMPQLHRETFKITSVSDQAFKVDYATDQVYQAERNDKLLSMLSQQLALEFPEIVSLRQYLATKVEAERFDLHDTDYGWIKLIYKHHLKHNHRVEVLTDNILDDTLGFSNSDYNKFSAAIQAVADFLITLGRASRQAVDGTEKEQAEKFVREYIEWTTCSLNYPILNLIQNISELADDKFNVLFSYYAQIYEQPDNGQYVSLSHCGDGFLPPFVITHSTVLFSPLAIRHLHPFTNILSSVSRKNRRLFDNQISSYLEPVLINQMHAVFSSFYNLKLEKNVNYQKGEIDFIVLSETENTCICFQVKATLTPTTSRSVARAEGRSLEGIEQLERFEQSAVTNQQLVINNAFGVRLANTKIIGILMVRSSAGSEKVWNAGKTITNYHLLTGLLGKKLKANDHSFVNFDQDLETYFQEMTDISKPEVEWQTFDIEGTSIEFPDINQKDLDVKPANLKDCFAFRDFEKAI